MNEIIVFVIIWIIITAFNEIAKRAKAKAEQEKKAGAPSSGPEKKPEIPNVLKDLLGIPEETPSSPAPRQQQTMERDWDPREVEQEMKTIAEDFRETVESEELVSEPIQKATEKVDELLKQTAEIQPLETEVWAGDSHLYHPGHRRLPAGRLRDAVLWKEILDKPLSLRHELAYPNRNRM